MIDNIKPRPVVRINQIQTTNLKLSNWVLKPQEIWCVLGNNASGKSQLAAALCGEPVTGTVEIDSPPQRPAWVGFETLQAQYEAELANDETDFTDRQDHGSTGLELLMESGAAETEIRHQAQHFGIEKLLDRGYRLFSSGELRRLQILAQWLRSPDLLILDEPFDALDTRSYAECSTLFQTLATKGQAILLLVNRVSDIPPWTTHLALLQNGKLIHQGPRLETLKSNAFTQILQIGQNAPPELPAAPPSDNTISAPLVKLTKNTVNYEGVSQFENFDWTLNPGEHTLITGPNGCGKSTLLALLTGDHPQCYTNQIEIFGYRRGSGESIWEIKKHIGYVSPSLHRDYRVSCSVETAVISGFHDSIGLYQACNASETSIARQWLRLFELQDQAKRSFSSLSYGQQRLALIARALVKQPPLVILDEPTQGLDDLNRHLVLACLRQLATLQRTTLLFVSHRQDEHLPLFRKHLTFEPTPEKSPRFRIRKLS